MRVLPKKGEIFWDRYDGLKPMQPVAVNSQIKTETGQLISPTVSQVHGYPGYCPRLHPIPNQCYGIQQQSLVWTYRSLTNTRWLILLQSNQVFQQCKTKSLIYSERWLFRPIQC